MKFLIGGVVIILLSSFSYFHFSSDSFGGFTASISSVIKETFLPESSAPADEFVLGSERKPLAFIPPEIEIAGSRGGSHPEILISEIQISPINERFIKLHNPNNFPVDLTGWYVQRLTQSGSLSSLVSSTNFQGKTIPAKGRFLIARPSSLLAGEADILANLTLTSANAILLKNPSREVADVLGYGDAPEFSGSPAPEPKENESLKRTGNTNNNSTDFRIVSRSVGEPVEAEPPRFGELPQVGESAASKPAAETQAAPPGGETKPRETSEVSQSKPILSLNFPSEIRTDEPFAARLSADGLKIATYDVKISVSTDDASDISDIYNTKTGWQWSNRYLTEYFTGNYVEDEVFNLRIRSGYLSYGGPAKISARIRETGKSGFLEYTGGLFIRSVPAGSSVAAPPREETTTSVQPPSSDGNSLRILIAEVQITGGAGLTTNDFVRIYNSLSAPFNLKGHRLVKRTKTGVSDTLLKSWTSDEFIPAGGYYTWANSSFTAISPPADTTTTGSIANDNGVAIREGPNDTGAIIDSVAWGEAENIFIEGNVYPQNPGANEVLGRKFASGVMQDTNNNAADFEIR